MASGEGAENLQPHDVQLRELAIKLTQNPDEGDEFKEWALLCNKERKPTIVAAIEQYNREAHRLSSKLYGNNDVHEEARTVSWGFSTVNSWLSTIKEVFETPPDVLERRRRTKTYGEATQDLADAVGEWFRTGKFKRPPLPMQEPILFNPDGSHRVPRPLSREQREKLNQQREESIKEDRFIKVLLAEDQTGSKALHRQLELHRRTLDPDYSTSNATGLMVIQMAIDRYSAIFNGIEQASWGNPNPHAPAK